MSVLLSEYIVLGADLLVLCRNVAFYESAFLAIQMKTGN